MAHFAKIENGIVQEVIVINNADCGNDDFPESEPIGQSFIEACGIEGQWLQTSYNHNFRGQFAGIGYAYDPELDEFLAPITEEVTE
jgi:hypothetical protein